MPRWRLFGWSDTWCRNGTGTRDLYVFGFRVWREHFTHSTALEH